MKEESIWVMDFKNQLIREKVMMLHPDEIDLSGILREYRDDAHIEYCSEYDEHVASRRTFSYPVSKEQDGKEIPESEFRLQHQYQNILSTKWEDCTEDFFNTLKRNDLRRIIAIPIGETDRQYEECLPEQKGELLNDPFIKKHLAIIKEKTFEYRNKIIADYLGKEQENDAIEFAKVYHNHVMETMQPPFKQRLSIEQLYKEYKNKP